MVIFIIIFVSIGLKYSWDLKQVVSDAKENKINYEKSVLNKKHENLEKWKTNLILFLFVFVNLKHRLIRFRI